jgi:hypothetical protein
MTITKGKGGNVGTVKRNLRRQIVQDLLITPWTYYPAGAGLAALMTNFFFVSTPILVFGGLVSITFAVFALAHRWFTKLDDVIEESFEKEQARLAREKEEQLDILIKVFEDSNDPEAKRLLKDLRSVYEEFQRVITDDKSNFVDLDIVRRVESLFTASIGYLKAANTNLSASKRMRLPNVKAQFMKRREEYIAQVQGSIEALGRNVGEIASLTFSQDNVALGRLAQELDDNLDVARQVQKRLAEMESPIGERE